MKLSKLFSTGLAALSTLAVVSPGVSARNPARLTSVPFVVAAVCTDTEQVGTATFASSNGKFILTLNATNTGMGLSYAGWEVFTSFPGVNPGNITPSAVTSAPAGTYSFTVSGMPSSGNYVYVSSVDADGNSNASYFPISNGTVSVTAPPVSDMGSALVSVDFWIARGGGFTSPVTVSNFTVNNSPLLIDTTHTDANPFDSGFSWCARF